MLCIDSDDEMISGKATKAKAQQLQKKPTQPEKKAPVAATKADKKAPISAAGSAVVKCNALICV